MTSPLETVNAFITALTDKRFDDALAMVADDVEYDNVPMGKNIGPDAMREVLVPMMSGCEEVDWPVHREAATGNIVMNERTDRFKLPFGWVEVQVCGVFEVNEDGKITLWRDYFDEESFRKQMPTAP